MKTSSLLFLIIALLPLTYLKGQNYLNYADGKPVTASIQSEKATNVTNGIIKDYEWRGSKKGQWIEVDLTASFEIHAAHIYFDGASIMPMSSWKLQYKKNNKWEDIQGTEVTNNFSNRIEQRFAKPVETTAIRLLALKSGVFGVTEFQLWGKDIPKIPYGVNEGKMEEFQADKHWVCVNQVGYNLNAPKFFTVPTAKKNLSFTIVEKERGKTVYRGKLKDGKGDFTNFTSAKEGVEYVIQVKGGGLPIGKSYPFEVKKRALQEMSYVPVVNFWNDARSVAGSHPSAYGGNAWRDGTYYTYELPSMVLLYLSDSTYFNNMSVTMSWKADSAKVLAPDFKTTKEHNDRDAIYAAQGYYGYLPAPKRADVPDLIQAIRFTAGWILLDPVSSDPSGGSDGERLHSQTVEQLAYFLYGYPAMKEYISDKFYKMVLDATFRWWDRAGLFDVIKVVGTGKGRDCPGHSIMPNLMMYEVAKREKPEMAQKFMDAAIAQTQWVIDDIDWNNPINTKGQRIGEHKLPTGLVHFYLNYPEQAPKGLKEKIKTLGERYVAMSDNMWDFRRFDLEGNWTIPGFNECGNVAAFPACALGVAMCVEDEELKSRLIQLGYSHFDALFGRNPMNVHAANYPNLSFIGADAGFPAKYGHNICARLEITRGSISSLPGSEMYPFNPEGKKRHPEGWTAYDANWSVGLAFLNFFENGTSGILRNIK